MVFVMRDLHPLSLPPPRPLPHPDASDSDSSSGEEYDSDCNQRAEARRSQGTPLGAGPAALSKFHVGLKTPESCVRRSRELDGEVCVCVGASVRYLWGG